MPSPQLLLHAGPLLMALVLALLLVPPISAASIDSSITGDYHIEETPAKTLFNPISPSYHSDHCTVHTSPTMTQPTPNFTYSWNDWDYTRWITINVIHDSGVTGTVVIADDPGRGEPGDYRLYQLRPADPSDIQERLSQTGRSPILTTWIPLPTST